MVWLHETNDLHDVLREPCSKLWSQIDDMTEWQCHNVASSVDAGLSMCCINKLFQSVAISSDNQLQLGSCFHFESPVRNGLATLSLKWSLMRKCTASYSILISGSQLAETVCSFLPFEVHEVAAWTFDSYL